MALYRLFRQEQTMADLAIDEAVGDELKNLDLARGRRLLRLRLARGDRHHLGRRRPPRRGDVLEMLRVLAIAIQDCITLCRIHRSNIGGGGGRL